MAARLVEMLKQAGELPRHVAIIMDGNGRWARARKLPRTLGHHAGMKSVREVVEGCIEAGVEILTLFAFSKENWSRPKAEVSALMRLLDEYIAKETADLKRNGVRVRVMGDRTKLSKSALASVERVEAETSEGDKLQLGLCISYSAREELTRAARLIAADVEAGKLSVGEVDEQQIARRLYTHPWPDPDLLIRTSGEMRVSNFLLWQLAYTEIYVTELFWPDFSREELFKAISDYQNRDRRFGKVAV
ncbi:MAG: isoprenyl transferase [Gemmatimonadota bacterium]|nr:isoprenyl transferase [Gemmatimonadota bacterium]